MVSIDSGIQEPPIRGYHDCKTSQIFIYGGCVKVEEYLYTRVIIWTNTILNHMDTTVIIPR